MSEIDKTKERGLETDFGGNQFASFRRQVGKISRSEHAVLITGESGTGKSHLAQLIHGCSHRAGKPFVELSCASIPADLLESELFGYKKGAFSGAYKDKVGLLESANGGTVFLDEIGDMPIALQPKILLFLQSKRFYVIGDNEQKAVDVRLIAATNHDLKQSMIEKRFRQDLYFRLNVFELELLPLRKRRQDIPRLGLAFLKDAFGGDISMGGLRFSGAALDSLLNYGWPGNIRELKNVMLRVATLVDPNTEVLPEHLPNLGDEVGLKEEGEASHCFEGKTLKQVEKEVVEYALRVNDGNRTKAAVQLGVSDKTVYNFIKRYHLEL